MTLDGEEKYHTHMARGSATVLLAAQALDARPRPVRASTLDMKPATKILLVAVRRRSAPRTEVIPGIRRTGGAGGSTRRIQCRLFSDRIWTGEPMGTTTEIVVPTEGTEW